MTAAGEYQAVPHLSLIRAEEVRTGMYVLSFPAPALPASFIRSQSSPTQTTNHRWSWYCVETALYFFVKLGNCQFEPMTDTRCSTFLHYFVVLSVLEHSFQTNWGIKIEAYSKPTHSIWTQYLYIEHFKPYTVLEPEGTASTRLTVVHRRFQHNTEPPHINKTVSEGTEASQHRHCNA